MPSSNVLKITIRKTDAQSCHSTTIDFDQTVSLKCIISDLCRTWAIPDSECFALLFNDSDTFVSEKNRCDIKNGSILRLSSSPSKTSEVLIMQLKSKDKTEKLNALSQLVRFSSDPTFSCEFIIQNGRTFLLDSLVDGSLEGSDDELTFTLEALTELGNQDSCDSYCTSLLVKSILSIINESTGRSSKLILVTLSILESIVNCSSQMAKLIEMEVSFENLISLIRMSQVEIQQNTLALINALLIKSELARRRELYNKLTQNDFRKAVLDSIVSNSTVGTEMAHQLHVLQSLILSLYTNEAQRETDAGINQLRRLAFHVDSNRSINDDLTKLGFVNVKNPSDELSSCPFALDLMIYYARNKREDFIKHVLERKLDREHECPFARASIQVTKLLYELLHIGEIVADEGQTYWPILFSTEHPLEDLFCESMNTLHRTWREMKALTDDFPKVISTLGQQLSRAFKEPDATKSFDQLRTTLNRLTYSSITELRQQEKSSREQWERQSESIAQLRNLLRPSIVDLIKKQRLYLLTKGTRFSKYSNKGQRAKDKYWFCRLTANHKAFIYADCEESKVPTNEELKEKIPVSEILELQIGRDCPHMKESKGNKAKAATHLAFALVSEKSTLSFVAPDQETFDHWIDGINALRDQEMTSQTAKNDLDTLLTMEIKIRLLDTEGVPIPEKQPELPPPPSNYTFHFS